MSCFGTSDSESSKPAIVVKLPGKAGIPLRQKEGDVEMKDDLFHEGEFEVDLTGLTPGEFDMEVEPEVAGDANPVGEKDNMEGIVCKSLVEVAVQDLLLVQRDVDMQQYEPEVHDIEGLGAYSNELFELMGQDVLPWFAKARPKEYICCLVPRKRR
ncbi:hypothetical protein N0V95_008955 [Ascochyta clinopodiicola]|nr:hypothetical protein N0V95_008955 [Ascochyta clinopodiicola]